MERVQRSFVLYWELVLSKFSLTPSQKSYVQDNLSKCIAWHLAYNSLEPQGKFKEAIGCYIKAIKLKPSKLKFYTAFIKASLKMLFGSKK